MRRETGCTDIVVTLALCAVIVVVMLFYMHDRSEGVRDKVINCIREGGTPVYTSDRYGNYRNWGGCIEVTR